METCEPRYCLSGIGFTSHTLIEADVARPFDVESADLDGDGDSDVLFATSRGVVGWQQNDGRGNFSQPQPINANALHVAAAQAADLDGDGDLDIFVEVGDGNKLYWHENVGRGQFADAQLIANDSGEGAILSDLDRDGDADIVLPAKRSGGISWLENVGPGANFAEAQRLTQSGSCCRTIHVDDMNGDGVLDLVTIGYHFGIELFDGGSGYTRTRIAGGSDRLETLAIGDVDDDGDLDILAANGRDLIRWFENTGSNEFQQRTAIREPDLGPLIAVTDMDGDQDLDLITFTNDWETLSWFEYDGQGGFEARHSVKSGLRYPKDLHTADVDGDGDLDVVACSFYNRIVWYQNPAGTGRLWQANQLVEPGVTARQISLTDVDLDGDPDLLATFPSEEKSVSWFENVGGPTPFASRVPLLSSPAVRHAQAVDLDGDGDRDLLVNSVSNNANIAWYANEGVAGYGAERPVRMDLSFPPVTADVDGDGDLDILHASSGRGLLWRPNVKDDGRTEFAPALLIDTVYRYASFALGDLDGDDDLDIVFATADQLWWYANLDGRGTFGDRRQIMFSESLSYDTGIRLKDMDMDGDLDIVTRRRTVGWHENTDGEGDFAERIDITPSEISAAAFEIVDIDGDGDPDIVAGLGNLIAWYPNEGGTGTFGESQPIDSGAGSSELMTGDVDGDGDIDVVVTGPLPGSITWYESDLNDRVLGDTDGNGIVDFEDFVRFAANFGRRDVTWRDGDFDCDGTITLSDFLVFMEHFR